MLTLSIIAIDNLKSHIRVNAVCPSWVYTPMNQASLQCVPQLGAMIKAASPLGGAAIVEEVADYIVFEQSERKLHRWSGSDCRCCIHFDDVYAAIRVYLPESAPSDSFVKSGDNSGQEIQQQRTRVAAKKLNPGS